MDDRTDAVRPRPTYDVAGNVLDEWGNPLGPDGELIDPTRARGPAAAVPVPIPTDRPPPEAPVPVSYGDPPAGPCGGCPGSP